MQIIGHLTSVDFSPDGVHWTRIGGETSVASVEPIADRTRRFLTDPIVRRLTSRALAAPPGSAERLESVLLYADLGCAFYGADVVRALALLDPPAAPRLHFF